MKMTIPYNVTGKAWKRLAEDVRTAINTILRHLGTPTMSYQFGDCLLDRNGSLSIPDTVDSHTARMLLDYLAEHGYDIPKNEKPSAPAYKVHGTDGFH